MGVDSMALSQEKSHYTYADYLVWNGDDRIEIMDGQIILQAAPSRIHQKISMEISRQIANFLEGKKCEVYTAPFAVRLFEKDTDIPEDVQTVFEPDISVICDKEKLDDYGCKGAPDMIIEIVSPSTLKRDIFYKMNKYQEAGVREYWIVRPIDKSIQVFLLKNGAFQPFAGYVCDDVAKVNILDDCFIELTKVFQDD